MTLVKTLICAALAALAILTTTVGGRATLVDGVLGEGWCFQSYKNAEYLGVVRHMENSGLCCQECVKAYPQAQMFNFYKSSKSCSCYKSIPRGNPVTVADKNSFAETCG